MKTKLIAATAMLSLVVSAQAQITKNIKYDWGWSYKLEMPETGLKCEFPEKPVNTQLAYGYMTSASFKDELFIAAKLENPEPYDIECRTQEFIAEMQKVHGLPISNLKWDKMRSENGNLTIAADSKGGYAQFHIDAIATEDALTIFIYSHHKELSVPGHFFANSYSVQDAKAGDLVYTSKEKQLKHAKVIERASGRSVVKLENSPITFEWPETPQLEVNRNEASYSLTKNESHYATRVVEVGPTVSYAFFNTFISKDQKSSSKLEVISDETEIPAQFDTDKEVFFRKMTLRTETGTQHRFYVAAENKIIVQELETSSEPTLAETRYLNTFEQSVRNKYDTRTLVLK
ncbi:MAG: hypothetical protein K9J17_13280 [Flavobacteriales bacterium]|nr:hypothetical protein [Flavobacteriales bacterium]